MNKFYVHYDPVTGAILGFYRTPPEDGFLLEITLTEYEQFVSNEKRMEEYIVAYGENASGEDELMLQYNVSGKPDIKNNRIKWVAKAPSENSGFIVTWDLANRGWLFKMTDEGKNTPSASSMPSTFYIVDRNNVDLLYRSIIVEYDDISQGQEHKVPFETDAEASDIMISVRSRFKNIGLQKHE
jgi:hypothetical protein